jgi:uncharacterized membrane protein
MSASDLSGLAFAALLAMGATAFLMRAAGFWLMGRVALNSRMHRMLEALPGSIVAATVLPIIAQIGPVAALAVGVALAFMIVLRSELLAVAAGVIAAALTRGLGA